MDELPTIRQQVARDLPGALITPLTEATTPHGQHTIAPMLAADDLLIAPEMLPNVVSYLRDMHGFTMLSNITAVDYLDVGQIEIVYHLAQIEGDVAAIKVRVDRNQAEVPSLTPFWPGADFQEREAFDLYGVRFSGHPNLRRIYMWDEFEGFPMRKDYPKQGDKYFGEGG